MFKANHKLFIWKPPQMLENKHRMPQLCTDAHCCNIQKQDEEGNKSANWVCRFCSSGSRKIRRNVVLQRLVKKVVIMSYLRNPPARLNRNIIGTSVHLMKYIWWKQKSEISKSKQLSNLLQYLTIYLNCNCIVKIEKCLNGLTFQAKYTLHP